MQYTEEICKKGVKKTIQVGKVKVNILENIEPSDAAINSANALINDIVNRKVREKTEKDSANK